MGGVFTAISDEPSGIYYNPAGISVITKNCIQAMYSKPYLNLEGVNLSLMSLSLVVPLEYVKLGISANVYDVQDGLYRETAGIISAASSLDKVYHNLPPVMLGINLKYLNKKYSYDEEILNIESELKGRDSKSAFSVDFGLLYKILKDRVSFGISVKDINQPNISVLEGADIIPMTISFGSVYNFGDINAGLYFEDLTLGVELRYRAQDWGDNMSKLFYGVGLETYFNFHTIAIRAGVNKNSINFGFGYYGFKIGKEVNIGFNYSFGLSTVFLDNLGNHKFVFEVSF